MTYLIARDRITLTFYMLLFSFLSPFRQPRAEVVTVAVADHVRLVQSYDEGGPSRLARWLEARLGECSFSVYRTGPTRGVN